MVRSLSRCGIGTEILSGDRHSVVAAVGKACGIAIQSGRNSPQQKLARVQSLQREGHRVLMLGDGLNDAPVLGAADVSIAMGSGTALAHASAEMILTTEDLTVLPAAIQLSRRMRRIVRQNLIWSASYNFGSLPLAALGLIPPWVAALGMSLSSVFVVLNATRLLPRAASASNATRAQSGVATGMPASAGLIP